MKGNVKKLSRRMLAMLICFAMALVLVPAPGVSAATVEENTDSVSASLDSQYVSADLVQTYASSCTNHNYTSVSYGTTCQTYAHTCYTCINCGDSYNVYPDEAMSDWQTQKPNVDQSMVETATQYRYCDYETVTSYDSELEDYERVGSQWVLYDQSAVNYVNEWPDGFDAANSLYNKYDNLAQKISNTSTELTKVEATSDQLVGYLYYHWCYSGHPYTSATQTGSYTRFHAYYSTVAPSSANASDPADSSYRFDSSTACSDSKWYFAVPVYAQSYTSYRNLFTYRCWGEPSQWSLTPVEATDGRQVETRTVYRYVTGALSSHNYVNGICSVCGEAKNNADFYLFGYINGANYGCEEDFTNMGIYKFANGKLTAQFTHDSYVGIKTEGNTNWYMTSGWQGNVTSVTLYNTNDLVNADKLFVPGGAELEFTLVDNGNDTLTLSYMIKECSHNYKAEITTAASCLNSGRITYTCTICGHSYIQNTSATGHTLVPVLTKPTCTEGGYTTYTCSSCGYSYIGDRTAEAGHSYSSTIVPNTCTEGGYTLYHCAACGYSYQTDYTAAGHSYVNGSCEYCGTADPNYSVTDTGFVLVTDISQITSGGKFVIVANNSGTYQAMDTTLSSGKFAPVTVTVDGSMVTGTNLPVWTVEAVDGGIAISLDSSYLAYNSSTNFKMDTTAYAWTVAAGETGFILNSVATSRGIYYSISAAKFGAYATSNADSSSYISNLQLYKYQAGTQGCSHSYTSKVTTAATCTASGIKTYTCSKCGNSYNESIAPLGHNYVSGSCSSCGAADPNYTVPASDTYYLIGWINGADHGCENDWQNPGNYKFENGKLTATFNQDSYVFVKTGDNSKWFLAESYCQDTTCTFKEGGTEKMFVPGGVELTFTLTENSDGSVTVCYATATASTVPTLTLKAPTLEFKDMITVNAMFTAENIEDVVEMGMITYTSKVSSWSVDTAAHVIPGTTYDSATARYIAASQGIHAKYLGDTVYLAVYAKLSDGTYAYSKLAGYSPVQYATSKLSGTDTKLKQLVVAMLNYGAAAQTHFNHNTGALANASLTDTQKQLPAAYTSGMVSTVPSVSAAKQGIFANNSGFAKRYPSISFEGAFCINYFFTPNYAPDNGITLYYWNEADYNAASVLTTANASGSFKLEGSGTGEYSGDIVGISAKALSEAVYVAAAYKDSSGTVWTSGVLGYSIGSYCASQSTKGGTIAELAKATAVYGYHAKAYFG